MTGQLVFVYAMLAFIAGFVAFMFGINDDLPGDTDEADLAIGILMAVFGPLTCAVLLLWLVGSCSLKVGRGFRALHLQLFPPPPEPPVPTARDVSGGDA